MLYFRYFDRNQGKICEEFLGFATCEATTGEVLADAFLNKLRDAGVDINKMRGQGYDGAANMSGRHRGVQARIRRVLPGAIYTHCKAHSLNLAIVHASKEAHARNTMSTVQEVAFLFNYSAKKTAHFKETLENSLDKAEMDRRTKLQSLCETRWASRADALFTFRASFGTVVQTLETLSLAGDTKAGAYRASLTQFSFIISLVAVEHVLASCVELSKLLQSVNCDLIMAASEAEVVIAQVTAERNDPMVWGALYERALDLAERVDVQPSMPRGGRQQNRPNAPAQTVSEYWRINMYLPFVDHLVAELGHRLLQGNERFLLQNLLPPKVRNLDNQTISLIFGEVSHDIPADEETFRRECIRWKTRCEMIPMVDPEKTPTLERALIYIPHELYPNVWLCLNLLVAMPVSTATAERSFSSMRRLKTYLRATMSTERLSGLGLLHVHRDRELDAERVVDNFAARKNRRLALVFNNAN